MKTSASILMDRLILGIRIEILPVPASTSLHFYAQCIGYLPDSNTLLITEPLAGTRSLMPLPGQWVRVRLLYQGTLISFQTTVSQRCTTPAAYLHLELPENLEETDIRAWPRVEVSMPVEMSSERPALGHSAAVAGRLLDISVGGALVEAPAQLGEAGDRIWLAGCFRARSVAEQALQIRCAIRQIRTRRDRQSGEIIVQHGLQFELEDSDEKVLLYSFIYERLIALKTMRLG